jgi:hypothetical protein
VRSPYGGSVVDAVPAAVLEDVDPAPEVESNLEGYVASNASTLVLSAVSGQEGHDAAPSSTRRAGRRCWTT